MLGLAFAVGYQYARENRDEFYGNATTAKATIESVEGGFLKGRKVKETYYNYWIVFDSYRFHYQWPEKYNVGDTFQVAYDPNKPSIMKPLSRVVSNKDGEWKVFVLFGVLAPLIFFWLSLYNFRELKWHNKTLQSTQKPRD